MTYKETFLWMLTDYIMEPIKKDIELHNAERHKIVNFLINDHHMLCVNRTKGVMRRPDTYDLDPYMLSYITNSSQDLFNNYNSKNTEKTEYLFLLDIHILMNVKNRPFMILEGVNKDTITNGNIILKNSDDYIYNRYGYTDNSDVPDDDIWEDFPDDDDDWEDDDSEE